MQTQEVMEELRAFGNDGAKKVLSKHGAREPFFGVKIEHLKKLQKRIKVDHALALELYATGNSDAMYLAGLIADDARMTRAQLEKWVKQAYWYMLSEYTIPWVASGSPHGMDLALKWTDSPQENIASSGWATLAALASVQDDEEIDFAQYKKLMQRVQKTIHQQPNRVRYTMNGFVIAVGSYLKPLHDAALKAAEKIGKVEVDMGGTSCKVPLAASYIEKVASMGRVGKKRKTAKC